tara:strand:- start:115 stop:285 length:171 start_codon:yes stop_codon:yes gene_type:complete
MKSYFPFLGVSLFFIGVWLGEHRHTPEEKAFQRFEWEMKQKLTLDQILLEAKNNEK